MKKKSKYEIDDCRTLDRHGRESVKGQAVVLVLVCALSLMLLRPSPCDQRL